MKTETTYFNSELEEGICPSCGDLTDEILIEDGRCVDCIQEEQFYDETMKGL